MGNALLRGVVIAAAISACKADEAPVLCPPGAVCEGAADAGDDLGRVDVPSAPVDVQGRDAQVDAPTPPRDAVPIRELVSLRVEPAAGTLVARGGAPATQDFTVTGTRSDGSTVAVTTAEWTATPRGSAAGSIDAVTGRFTASGTAGARFMVTATVARPGSAPLTATVPFDVRVEQEDTGTGAGVATPLERMRYAMAARTSDPAMDANVLYPLHDVLVPANAPPPEVQWERGAAGELFVVRARKPHGELRHWVRHTGAGFRFAQALDPAGWRALVESDPDDPITLRVDRFDPARATVLEGREVRVRVARVTLSGAVYYWDLNAGRILRIDAITGMREVAIPSPPPKPDEPDRGSRCVACHVVSRTGRYMAAQLWGGGRPGAVFDLTSSALRSDPAPTLFTPSLVYEFSTFSPDGALLVVNRGNSLLLMERDTGRTVSGTGLDGLQAAHPSWSPDGTRLAVAVNTNGTWAVDFTRSDLAIIPRTSERMFGTPRVMYRGSTTPDRLAVAHPSWSPDSRWIAIQHGTNSRGANSEDRMAPAGYPGRIELVDAESSDAASLPLERANGAGNDSYWPVFSPFNAGGYFWVAFYSRRDYGNAQAGTRGTRRRQIWVTAIANNPRPGEDPSNVPYWLAGQDTRVDNMAAQWAPTPCRANGESCSVSAECCSGTCQRGADGMFRCTSTPMAECRPAGRTCATNADCCAGLVCFANVCGLPPS